MDPLTNLIAATDSSIQISDLIDTKNYIKDSIKLSKNLINSNNSVINNIVENSLELSQKMNEINKDNIIENSLELSKNSNKSVINNIVENSKSIMGVDLNSIMTLETIQEEVEEGIKTTNNVMNTTSNYITDILFNLNDRNFSAINKTEQKQFQKTVFDFDNRFRYTRKIQSLDLLNEINYFTVNFKFKSDLKCMYNQHGQDLRKWLHFTSYLIKENANEWKALKSYLFINNHEYLKDIQDGIKSVENISTSQEKQRNLFNQNPPLSAEELDLKAEEIMSNVDESIKKIDLLRRKK